MGLDQWAFAIKGDEKIELQTWRKHADLQGFMEQIWMDRGGRGDFNCVDLKLTIDNLTELQSKHKNLPTATGFFWGASTDYKVEQTEHFINEAMRLHSEGWEIIYSSWW